MFTSGAGQDDGTLAYTFGEQPQGMNTFDFEFNALTTAPEMSAITQPVDTMQVWQQPSPIENAIDGISPSALKVETMIPLMSSSSSRSSVEHTPTSVDNQQITPPSSNSSPEPQPVNARKRKSTQVEAEVEKPGRKNAKHQPVKKTAHNMIEKRYRTKLNDKIEELKKAVPSLKRMSSTGFDDDDDEDLDGLTPAHKTNKATVLSKATEYIKHLERRNKTLNDEMIAMKAEMDKCKKVALSATVPFNNVSTPDPSQYQEDPFGSNPPSTPGPQMQPQGMIPVPESIMSLHAAGANQPHYARAYPSYTSTPRAQGNAAHAPMVQVRGGQPFNKFMVGALAGLMIIEGLSEHEDLSEKSEARGLFSLPVHLLGRRSTGLSAYNAPSGSSMTVLQLLKAFLLLGALVYLIYPLFNLKPKWKKKAVPALRLAPIPSLASPIEVRQKAWLTAIQTVWVPHHNFFYELAALALKTLKLSTRRLIGWRGYASLTGTTKEQEEGRVKAWKIALDAQLTGGDAEISISRLVLTLMASGTLPDTPARLMLNALHIRVLLWEVAKAGYGSWYMFDELCANLARKYWNAARAEHKLNVQSGSRSRVKVSTDPDEQVKLLPDHLAALLQLECDDVLKECIVQRAYNLAWNKPSAEHTDPDESMDSVVEDFGISSPLDALAAWWSNQTLKKALTASLATSSSPSPSIVEEVDLAAKIAPPTSSTYSRAMVARAVLLDEDRPADISAAMTALPLPPRGQQKTLLENEVSTSPVPGDITVALTLAKCYWLLQFPTDNAAIRRVAHARAVTVINSTQVINYPWTLLSFVAAYKVLNVLASEDVLSSSNGFTQRTAEKLSGSLRLCIGRQEGSKLGLGKSTRNKVSERCLSLRKVLVGFREDDDDGEKESGYGSAED